VPTEDIIREMKGILKGKKSRYPTEITDLIIQELEALAEIVKHKVKITVIEKNPEDDGVPECAHELQADFVISEDRYQIR
jgi:rRNA-processing protein FCF1